MNQKPHIKSIAYASSITLVISIIIGCGLIYEQNHRIQSLQGANRSLTSEIQLRKTREGKLISDIQAGEVRAKDLERMLPEVAKTITKEFEVKLKNARAYAEAQFEAKGKGNALIKPLQSIPYDTSFFVLDSSLVWLDNASSQLHVSYSTRPNGSWYYLSSRAEGQTDTVEFTIDPPCQMQPFAMFIDDGYLSLMSEIYSQDRAPYEYTYRDTVKTVFHMKGKLLQKKQLYSSSMLSNKNATVVGSQAILVNEFKDKRWGIGPSVSYGVGPDGLNWNVGISIHYSVIKF